MKLGLGFALTLFCSCTALPSGVSQAPQSSPGGERLALYLGQRNLDEDDYDPVDEQPTFGIEYSSEAPDSTIGWEVGLMGSKDEDTVAGFDLSGSTGELYGGIRKSFGEGTVRPYIGAGLSAINSELEVAGLGSEDDSSLAGYAHGGLMFDVSQSFFLGIDVRVLFGSDVSYGTFETDVDYGQLALVLGWRF